MDEVTEPIVAETEEKPQDVGVVVDLEKKEEPKAEVKDAKPAESDSVKNALNGAYRIIGKLQKEVEQLKANQPHRVPSTPQEPTESRYNKLAEDGQWIKAVEEIAENRAKQIIDQKEAERQFNQVQNQRESIRQAGMSEVTKRYPELDEVKGDPESVVSKVFSQVLDLHPEYASSEFGPKLAMRDMEEILETQHGIPLRRETQKEVVTKRPNQGYLPPGRPSGKPGTVTLSREQKEFCDHHKIPYENYAKNVRMSERNQEVTL